MRGAIMNKFGITCKFIPKTNEEINKKPKYEVISLEKDESRISAISRNIYSHFTSLDNALDILINQRMKACTVIKHKQEKECYSNEDAERKYSISFSHDLTLSQENGMFNAFGDKHRGCEITFIVDKNEKFDDVFFNDDEYVDLFNKNNKFMKQNILNRTQPINLNYDYQNETALTLTINKISNITQDEISNIEYMIVRICIEKIKLIKIKFGKKVNDDRKRDFIEELSKKNYTNIIYEN